MATSENWPPSSRSLSAERRPCQPRSSIAHPRSGSFGRLEKRSLAPLLRGRDERSSLLEEPFSANSENEVRGDSPSPGSHLRCDPTSPRKRGEVSTMMQARAARVQHIQSSYAGLPLSPQSFGGLAPIARRSLGVDGTRVSINLQKSFVKRDGLPGRARQ
jgi:hypothetical protein